MGTHRQSVLSRHSAPPLSPLPPFPSARGKRTRKSGCHEFNVPRDHTIMYTHLDGPGRWARLRAVLRALPLARGDVRSNLSSGDAQQQRQDHGTAHHLTDCNRVLRGEVLAVRRSRRRRLETDGVKRAPPLVRARGAARRAAGDRALRRTRGTRTYGDRRIDLRARSRAQAGRTRLAAWVPLETDVVPTLVPFTQGAASNRRQSLLVHGQDGGACSDATTLIDRARLRHTTGTSIRNGSWSCCCCLYTGVHRDRRR